MSSAWQRLTPLTDLITPMAVRVAATLRLADLVLTGLDVEDIARRTGTDPGALGRMMRHLAARGVFTEPAPGRFALTELGGLLRSDHPDGMRVWLDLDGFGGPMDLAFTELLHTVRTGGPAWERVFGAPFWDHLDANPGLAASFDATMVHSRRAAAAAAYDWSEVRHVVDVGGGTGALLAEVLATSPSLRATLVDLPGTVARGREYLASRGLADRCAYAGQSFFDPLPPGGDVYVLAGVLHDWPDEEAVAILRRCAEALGPDGRVAIVEWHGDEAGDAAGDTAAFTEMDLRMLVLCGGRERTAAQYGGLAAAAGLAMDEVRPAAGGHAIVVCTPRV